MLNKKKNLTKTKFFNLKKILTLFLHKNHKIRYNLFSEK